MEIQQKPDYLIFAEGSKSGELSDFPDISRGWGITLEQTQAKPPLEWMNSAFNRIDKNTLYLLQQGVPEWSESVLYPIGAIIKVDGTLYEAKTQNTNLNPVNSHNDWQLVVRFQDATTKQKGIVQLSSATDSESETQAATPKAVKTVYDLAKNSMQLGAGGIGLATQTATNGIDIDTYDFNVGFYSGNNWSSTKGLPFGKTASDVWFYLINQNLASDGNDYKLQILGLNQTGTPRLAMRYKVKGNWTDWAEFISSKNISDYSSNGLGYGQTWQDVTPSRQLNVTYTNNTGKPIIISIKLSRNATSSAGCDCIINENQIDSAQVPVCYNTNSGGGNVAVGQIVVPLDSTYKMVNSAESSFVSEWFELR